MREIKFRAWDKKANKMHSGISLLSNIVTTPEGCHFLSETDNHIYMQFTGLKDKNGKEIYEEDLIRCDGKCMEEKQIKYSRIGLMNWSNMKHGFVLFLRNHNAWCYPNSISYVPDTLEVIGNIYENLELVKNDQEI